MPASPLDDHSASIDWLVKNWRKLKASLELIDSVLSQPPPPPGGGGGGGGVPTTRTLTHTGTATRLTVTPSTAQDLSADRTWTHTLPDLVHILGLNLNGITNTPLTTGVLVNNDPLGTGFATRAAGDFFTGGASGAAMFDESLIQWLMRSLATSQRYGINMSGSTSTNCEVQFVMAPAGGTNTVRWSLFRTTNTSGQVDWVLFRGNNTATMDVQLMPGASNRFLQPTIFGAIAAPYAGVGIENRGAYLAGSTAGDTYPIEAIYTNKSGSTRSAGDIVVISTGTANAYTTTTTVGAVSLGVVQESTANNANGRVAIGGVVSVTCVTADAIAIGDKIGTSGTAGQATKVTSGVYLGTAQTSKAGGTAGSVKIKIDGNAIAAAGNGDVPVGGVIFWVNATGAPALDTTIWQLMDGSTLNGVTTKDSRGYFFKCANSVSAGNLNTTEADTTNHVHTQPTHTHTFSGTTGAANDTQDFPRPVSGTLEPLPTETHTHDFSGTTDAGGNQNTGSTDANPPAWYAAAIMRTK